MQNESSILIIDDEIQIRRLLRLALESAGYRTLLAETAAEGMQIAATHTPAMIILDLGLPDLDGVDLLSRLREWCTVPIIILSVRDNKNDIISALDRGADDYLTKPFHTGELLARIRSALRHTVSSDAERSQYHFAGVDVDLSARTVLKDNLPVKLTATEFNLLSLLIRNAGKVLTHAYILERVWGHAYIQETQYSRIYIAQLRKKLENDPASPSFITTEPGIGYRFVMEE